MSRGFICQCYCTLQLAIPHPGRRQSLSSLLVMIRSIGCLSSHTGLQGYLDFPSKHSPHAGRFDLSWYESTLFLLVKRPSLGLMFQVLPYRSPFREAEN